VSKSSHGRNTGATKQNKKTAASRRKNKLKNQATSSFIFAPNSQRNENGKKIYIVEGGPPAKYMNPLKRCMLIFFLSASCVEVILLLDLLLDTFFFTNKKMFLLFPNFSKSINENSY
jgi:hypothetical protein